MSFGFSPSDVLALIKIVTNTYQGWKKACGEYSDITYALDGLLNVLERIQIEATKAGSILCRNAGDQKDLKDILAGCEATVSELDGIVNKYKSLGELGRSREKNWDRLRFGVKNLDDLRAKLTQHMSTIGAYLDIVGLGALTRIEINLDGIPRQIQHSVDFLAAEIRAGRREGSIMTTYTDDDKDVWRQFRREMISDGVRSSKIHKYKPRIKRYLQVLAESGQLDEEVPSDVVEDAHSVMSEEPDLPARSVTVVITSPDSTVGLAESRPCDKSKEAPDVQEKDLAEGGDSLYGSSSQTQCERPPTVGEAMVEPTFPTPFQAYVEDAPEESDNPQTSTTDSVLLEEVGDLEGTDTSEQHAERVTGWAGETRPTTDDIVPPVELLGQEQNHEHDADSNPSSTAAQLDFEGGAWRTYTAGESHADSDTYSQGSWDGSVYTNDSGNSTSDFQPEVNRPAERLDWKARSAPLWKDVQDESNVRRCLMDYVNGWRNASRLLLDSQGTPTRRLEQGSSALWIEPLQRLQKAREEHGRGISPDREAIQGDDALWRQEFDAYPVQDGPKHDKNFDLHRPQMGRYPRLVGWPQGFIRGYPVHPRVAPVSPQRLYAYTTPAWSPIHRQDDPVKYFPDQQYRGHV